MQVELNIEKFWKELNVDEFYERHRDTHVLSRLGNVYKS